MKKKKMPINKQVVVLVVGEPSKMVSPVSDGILTMRHGSQIESQPITDHRSILQKCYEVGAGWRLTIE